MTPNDLLSMFQKFRPDWYEPLHNIAKGGDLVAEYTKLTRGTLEEVTRQVHAQGESLVIELPFEWTDFGTWESLEKYYIANNIESKKGEVVEIDAQKNFCFSENRKKIAIIGVENIFVIESDDGILICNKKLSGRVGEVV